MKKKIAILGSTGSIGKSCLDICRGHFDKFEVLALAAGRNTDLLLEQVKEFSPKLVSVTSESDYQKLKNLLPPSTKIIYGGEGLRSVATFPETDLVVSAIVGAAGLDPTIAAIQAGKTIALANKESMIVAGELMSKLAEKHKVKILPVDSEHSAIFQCLNGENHDDIHKLILTASGGPFLNLPLSDFSKITKVQALKHPNWDMGSKITIDSATMMNKGLEVIEAHFLFGIPAQKIEINVHPQSIVHSLVEFIDGSVMAQLGEPDMRVPIAYALSYPRRMATPTKRLSLPHHKSLSFFNPDFKKFPCLQIAFDVLSQGKSFIPVLNAANEVAVARFLNDEIHFTDIPKIIERILDLHNPFPLQSLEDVFTADVWAREKAQEFRSRMIA